ncbi:MAG: hypothetical protein DWQ34_23230 [Planctomycetota bacterium]|nr:MAG: hypothetical protein DWQ29_19560 [Planctomycetota bacterium]REJ88044.1 MAG: hypothetical protein DWQ34_23230 [Planctomycetota bacterium]REK24209.1 MAG: hypothetical protein DWQ41_14320 [Planctomycetota bacterium]REK28803.1 MAG: hypothetical protein DWQ45_24195 [Planctomycetota bacterium]
MRQVKLFKGVEAEIGSLESEVNSWIRESQVDVVGVRGNIAPQSTGGPSTGQRFTPSDILIIVEYETSSP